MCSVTDAKYAAIATTEAYKSDLAYRHGCIAVVSGKIVARGYNHYRTISQDGLIGRVGSCHAEIDVLRKCLKKNIKKKISLYVVRLSVRGTEIMQSDPCIDCYAKMQQFGIKNITYSDRNGNLHKTPLSSFTATHKCSGSIAIEDMKLKPLGIP